MPGSLEVISKVLPSTSLNDSPRMIRIERSGIGTEQLGLLVV